MADSEQKDTVTEITFTVLCRNDDAEQVKESFQEFFLENDNPLWRVSLTDTRVTPTGQAKDFFDFD